MKRAIAVARVSTDEQAAGDDRTSIDTQLAAIEAWCARAGYEVVERVREEGISVTGVFDREDDPFWEAYERLKAGAVETIVFNEHTRLSRSDQPWAVTGLLMEARAFGDGIQFVQEPRAGDPASDSMLAFIRSWSATEDARRRKEATLRGQRARLERGEVGAGIPPLGYRRNPETRRYEVEPHGAEIVRTVFHLYVNELRSFAEIADELNARRWPAPRGGRWVKGTIRGIVLREAYATGLYARGLEGVSYELATPPLVDPDVFARAQEIRAGRSQPAPGEKRSTQPGMRTGDRGLVQGLIVCGLCGERVNTPSGRRRGSRRGKAKGTLEHRYRCKAALAHREGCQLPELIGWRVDERVWGAIMGVIRDDATFQQAARAYAERLADEIARLSPELRRAQSGVAELEQAQTNLLLGFERASTERQRRRLQARLDELERRKAEAERPLLENAGLARRLARLEADRERILRNVEQYGGAFTVEDQAEIIPLEPHEAEEAAAAGEQPSGRPRRPDEPFDPHGRVVLRYRGTGDPSDVGTRRLSLSEEIGRRELVDLLQTRVTLWPERARVEGVVEADLRLGKAVGPPGTAADSDACARVLCRGTCPRQERGARPVGPQNPVRIGRMESCTPTAVQR